MTGKRVVISTMLAVLLSAAAAQANQFPYLDPAYVQEIYTGPLVGAPGAWTSGGNLLVKNGSNILEYSLTQNAVHQGTNIHGVIATHSISGLNATGYGITRGLDGYIYTTTGAGLQRFDPNNWAAPAQSLSGTVGGGGGYGITTLPDGRIAYVAGGGTNELYVYNPSTLTNTLIYTAPSLVDDIEAGPAGVIALAWQSNSGIIIVNSAGALINSFLTLHYPDGLAFGNGVTSTSLFSNNNDGTISQYVLGPGYTGTPVVTDIATGSGAYGDIAAVGPDCAFYVTQFENGGLNGSTPGIGTHWDNGVTNAEPSIIRIALANGECGFYSTTNEVPEPATLSLLALGGLALLRRRRQR